MKASCVDEKDEGRETQQELPSLSEMAPLFSSLHVNDAGKPGFMSNRLALHEQFTVSPQRFQQLSAPCRPSAAPYSCSEECVLNDCHHFPTPHMPLAPAASKAQGFACPFFGTMDGITMCTTKSAENNTLLDTVAMNARCDKLKHVAAKTADARLPSSCSLDKAESNDGHAVCDTPAADVMKLVKGAQYLSIAEGLQHVSDLKQAGLTLQSEGCSCASSESAEGGGNIIVKDEVLTVSKQDQDTSCKEYDRRTSNECCSNPSEIKNLQSKVPYTEGVDRPMPNDVEVPGPCNAERHRAIIEDDLEHWEENLSDARCTSDNLIKSSSICKMEVETAVLSRDTNVSTKLLERFSSILNASSRENTGKAAREMPCISARNKCGACGESANKDSCLCGAAESSQEDIAMGNSSNNLETCYALSISPKAVIHKIGQLRFWKARLTLIRQQQIFSDQVFELHKLIQVQQLLAGTPYTSIDEIYYGVGNMNLECDADALGQNKNVGDALGKQILSVEEAVEFPTVVGETKTKSINSQAYLEQSPAVSVIEESGVSEWGCPSLGVKHLTESLPAAGACPYPPFAGGFTPGSAVGGPFAAPVVGVEGAAMIRSQMFPFSFPVGLQKPQLLQRLQSSYRSAIACANRQHSASCHSWSSGQEVSDHSAPETLNKMNGAAEGPMFSVATMSSQPGMSQQRVKVEYPSSFNSQQYLHEEGMQPGRQGLTMSGSKREDLQHSVMGLRFNSSTARFSDELGDCSEHNIQGLSQAFDSKLHNYDATKKESLFKELRGCKRQKERKQQDSLTTGKVIDVNNSLNPSLVSLNLFPLAPALSLDEQSKRRPLGRAKEWQDHVRKVIPRAAISTPESAAGILLSIQQERKPHS